MTDVTPELIRTALSYVPADLDHDTWRSVGMAINDALPDADGLDIFDSWSAGATEGYNRSMVRAKWRSFAPGRGIGVGTLFEIAKRYGFTPPKADQAPAAPTPAELAERQRQQAARRQQEEADRRASHEGAAAEAQALWDGNCKDVTDPDQAPYLKRKGVKPYGVRFTSPGTLVVPLRDALGKLWNVQRIAASKPKNGAPEKWFIKGARKSGLWHLLVGEQGDVGNTPAVLLIAEGYGTAASLHEATGYSVAVAFDAGNLQHVARALRKAHPAALLVVCGDDDRDTEAKTGNNPGRQKATEAAKAVRGLAVFPEGLPEGGSDFNDLHQHLGGSAGLDAVRMQVQAAIDTYMAERQAVPNAKKAKAQGMAPPASANGASGAHAAPGGGFDNFIVNDEGLWYLPRSDDGPSAAPFRVCAPLYVTGLARDTHDNQAALVLEFDAAYRKGRRWLMPLAMLSGDGSAYRAALLSQGFMTPTDAKRRTLLTSYLQSRTPSQLVRHVPRVGWYGRCYVLPDETLGQQPDGDHIMFHSEVGIEANFNRRGTLEAWQQNVSRLCVGNSRMVFAVATALAGPLLAWSSGTSGGGFHFVGPTSIGKTTGFLAAASVWGKGTESDPESYIQKWRATSNGLEYQGEQHNDCTLILDELGQLENGDAGASAYMLADGQGKTRAKGIGALRPKPTWRLLFLSSGEITLAQQMAANGKLMKGGQEVRLIPIPAEVSPGSAHEVFHEFGGGHELSGFVKHHAGRIYGVAGRAWLEHLVAHTDGLAADLRQRMDRIEADLVPESAVGQVKRGGRRFALVAAAGEMATAAGLTGWPAGEAERAARSCFNAWLASRGGSGSSEVSAMLRQVRSFLELHGEGRFGYLHRSTDEKNAKTLYRAGWRRVLSPDGRPISRRGVSEDYPLASRDDETVEYLVLPEVFRKEIAAGFDAQTVAQVLADHECLVKADKGPEGGRFTKVFRIPGTSPVRCYQITPRIFELDL